MKTHSAMAVLLALPLLAQPAAAQTKAERLYVIECGARTAPDVSLWTPGVNVGKPVDFVDTCYLIKHGSVTIISTPGHTPGHQSLLVKLPQTGAVALSGDAVHLKDNWDARRVPSMNVDKDKSTASMQRMSALMARDNAQLWINHDKPQSETMKRLPEFYQ